MPIGEPKSITKCRDFFLEPMHPRHRMYEALRAYFLEKRPSAEVARTFGYTPGSFRVLCHHFRHDPEFEFFASPRPGPRTQPKKVPARKLIVQMRKINYSVYDISEALKEKGIKLSPTAVREVLKEEGFAALPRRLDEERPSLVRPTIEPVADVRRFSLQPRQFTTRVGGLFLFIADLVCLDLDKVAQSAHLPGSAMIPREHALRACLALKLWSIERKSHIMALVADEGLGLFAGLNVIPKKSYFSEYSCRIEHAKTTRMLAAWHEQLGGSELFPGQSFNLDFHSAPYYGEDPLVESNYVSMRSRSQPSILVFLAQDADGQAFCYCNADIRKREAAEEIFRFISFWKSVRGEYPHHLVFDSKLTTHSNLARLDDMGITFITLRSRSPKLLREIENLPPSAWRRVRLDVFTRKYRTPLVYEQTVKLADRSFRQVYAQDLGHDEPTILLSNDRHAPVARLVIRYAQRMIVENSISDAVRFFHMDALSSKVGLKVDLDMALLVIANGLYRLFARRMKGYSDAQARTVFRDLIDIPADVSITQGEVNVRFHRRAHLPIIIASGILNQSVDVPWWNGYTLRLTG